MQTFLKKRNLLIAEELLHLKKILKIIPNLQGDLKFLQ